MAFLHKGFTNWKDATYSFRRHECSKCHQEAVQKMIVYPNSISDVGELVSSVHAHNKVDKRKVLLKILQNDLKFLGLGRQGIPFRGHEDVESNFIQFIKLRELDNPELSVWMRKKTDKYLSPKIQNEMLLLMSLAILRTIAMNIHSSDMFTIMADEW